MCSRNDAPPDECITLHTTVRDNLTIKAFRRIPAPQNVSLEFEAALTYGIRREFR